MSRWTLLAAFIAVLCSETAGFCKLTTVRIASGLEKPLQVTAPPGDCGRIFVVEQDGRILTMSQEDMGGTPSKTFLDISDRVAPPDQIGHDRSEQGLLSMAFHPDYDSNGFFYVHYIEEESGAGPGIQIGDSITARYSVSADPDVADRDSEHRILVVDNNTENHNGGTIAFSPLDGHLYVSLGIMAGAAQAQDLSILQGKMLRLDVDGEDFPEESDRNYAIPADNPFVSMEGARGEIWAMGLRQPWRFSFDRENGDMYIGDVGGGRREELNYQAGSSDGGENYGYQFLEGTVCFDTPCDLAGLTAPIWERSHVANVKESIIGGHVYRGTRIPDLAGTYFYGDWWVNGSTSSPVPDGMARFWSLRMVAGEVTELQERTAEFDPGGGLTISNLTSFGEDALGELYMCARANAHTLGQGLGEVYKIVAADDPQPLSICPRPESEFIRGDCNADDEPDISDGVFSLQYLFTGSAAPDCIEACDSNNDRSHDVSDPVHLFIYLFLGGTELDPPFPGCGVDPEGQTGLGCHRLACDSGL